MKVFVAGATGVLGRRVVERLVRRRHTVVGLSRSATNETELQARGARPAAANLFDRAALVRAVAGCEAVLHLATAIPVRTRTSRRDWAPNDRIRREGTANLVHAALEAGANRFVLQSVTFLYGNLAGASVDETTPIDPHPGGVLESAADMERLVAWAGADRGLPAVVLRCASFYAPDAAHTRAMLEGLRRRALPIVGDGANYLNLVHADDAAAAVERAVEADAACVGETINVCDGHPVTQLELFHAVAALLGAKPPRRVPVWLARLAAGGHAVDVLLGSVRCRNEKARRLLGWQPGYPSYREGFDAILREAMGAPRDGGVPH